MLYHRIGSWGYFNLKNGMPFANNGVEIPIEIIGTDFSGMANLRHLLARTNGGYCNTTDRTIFS